MTVTVFFFCPCKLFSFGTALGNLKPEEGRGRKGILLQMRMRLTSPLKNNRPTFKLHLLPSKCPSKVRFTNLFQTCKKGAGRRAWLRWRASCIGLSSQCVGVITSDWTVLLLGSHALLKPDVPALEFHGSNCILLE